MSTKEKIWRPGQLVTIDSKVYRVVKDRYGCANCENVHIEPFNTPCVVCLRHTYTGGKVLKELKQNK